MQAVCGWQCAKSLGRVAVEKIEKQKIKLLKEKLKTRNEWLKTAQTAFNAFIRARDKDLPCISCGTTKSAQWDASHYRSVGAAPAFRFVEDNCHKSCVVCNRHKSGNIFEYRLRLIKKIGIERVEALEREPPPMKHTIENAKEIAQEYRKKLKEIKNADF